MNAQEKKVQELIEQAKQGIKENDAEKAVSADAALIEFRKLAQQDVTSRVHQHSSQYNFITQYRIVNQFKSALLLIVSVVSILLGFRFQGVIDYVLFGGGIFMTFSWLMFSRKINRVLSMLKREEDQIIAEKALIYNNQNLMHRISEYHMQTFDQMTEMYKMYEKMQEEKYKNQGLNAIFGNASQIPEQSDSEEETHS